MSPSESDPRATPPAPSNETDGAAYGLAMPSETTQLMAALQAGDAGAFDDLVRELRGRAFHVACTLVGSREDALELCQEAFLKVFRARASYDPSQPFLPWFHRILRNTCFSFLRRHRRLRKHSLSAHPDESEGPDWEIVDPSPDPSELAMREERSLLFQRAIAELSSRDREILALRHFQELSYKEIASALDIPEGTVMSRLFHARKRLKRVLAPLLAEQDAGPVTAEGGAR